MTAAKDTYRIQRERIEGIIAEMAPGNVVKWDEEHASAFLRFYVETAGGTVLIPSSGDNRISDIEAKSDDELRQLLTALSDRKFIKIKP